MLYFSGSLVFIVALVYICVYSGGTVTAPSLDNGYCPSNTKLHGVCCLLLSLW